MISWHASVEVLTLFVADLAHSRAFYRDQIGLSLEYEDGDSVVFDCGGLSLNLVGHSSPDFPSGIGHRRGALVPRMRITLDVEDVDEACAELIARGVTMTSSPTDRAGGFRNATFIDPDGYVWEVVQQLPQARTASRIPVDIPRPASTSEVLPTHAQLVATR